MTDVRDTQILGKVLETDPSTINDSQVLGKVLETNTPTINDSQVLGKVLETNPSTLQTTQTVGKVLTSNTREIRNTQVLGKVLRSVTELYTASANLTLGGIELNATATSDELILPESYPPAPTPPSCRVLKPWNCHCVPDGPTYSGSVYDNPYDTTNTCADGRCNDSVFATIYSMDFNFAGTLNPLGRPCCPKYKQRYYNLYYQYSLSDVCIFHTLEIAGYDPEDVTGNCINNDTPLAAFSISKNLGGFGDPPYAFHVGIAFSSLFGGSMSLEYGSDFSNNPINCLSPITLPIVSNASAVSEWNARVCILGVAPLSIVLTPV